MTDGKRVPVSFRVTPQFKQLLALAAEADQRSQTNLLEKLLLDHCRRNGISAPEKDAVLIETGTGSTRTR